MSERTGPPAAGAPERQQPPERGGAPASRGPRPCPGLGDLPAPPAGRAGWPWSEASPRLPERAPDGGEWPSIAIVTPSFNQADYLEATLRSVLLQGYPRLEYIVMDGGSTDGSVEILRRYAPWLAWWRSAPDAGQSDAINRGFALAESEVLGWVNSDDTLYPRALCMAATTLRESGADMFLGGMDKVEVGEEGERVVRRSRPDEGMPIHLFPILRDRPSPRFHFFQPSMLWRRGTWEAAGPLDESYHYVMDLEWCNRALAAGATVCTRSEPLARFTLHAGSKSQELEYRFARERLRMYRDLARRPGFRRWACLLSMVRPAQRLLSHLGAREAERGRPLRARALRAAAGALKWARRVVPGLEGARSLRAEEELR